MSARDQAILRERAQKLAHRHELGRASLARQSAALFERSGVVYAIETAYVLQVVRVLAPTPLPLTHPCWRGLTSLHGELLGVIDLPRLLDEDAEAPAAAPSSSRAEDELESLLVMVLGKDRPELGLVLDALREARALSDDVMPLSASGGGGGLLRGATPDGVRIVEAEALLRDPRLSLATSDPSTS